MAEMVKTTPRVKATPTTANPDLMLGVGEKGGISLYGLQRFPITLYWEQWQALLDEELIAEIATFAETHKEHLSDGRPVKATAAEAERKIGVTAAELALLDSEIAKLKAANDFDGAVKYATIKANARGGKLPLEDMLEVYKLKAR